MIFDDLQYLYNIFNFLTLVNMKKICIEVLLAPSSIKRVIIFKLNL